jgi:hypothetical protein
MRRHPVGGFMARLLLLAAELHARFWRAVMSGAA